MVIATFAAGQARPTKKPLLSQGLESVMLWMQA